MNFESKATNRNRMFAAAIVAVLMVASFGALLSEDSDAIVFGENYNGDRDVYMFTGQQFSYTPTVSLSGTTIDVASPSPLSWNGTVLSGTFATKPSGGQQTITVTADWTSGSLHQTAEQNIIFHVFDVPTITVAPTSVDTVVANADEGDILASFSETHDSGTNMEIEYTVMKDGSPVVDNSIVVDEETRQVKVGAGEITPGTYTVTGTISSTIAATGNTATDDAVLTITVSDDLMITFTQNNIETYLGADDITVTINSNVEDIAGNNGLTLSDNIDSLNTSGLVSRGGATVSINTDGKSNDDVPPLSNTSGAEFVEYAVQITGSTTVNTEPVTTTQTLNVKIFRALEFTTVPTIASASGVSSTGNPLDMLLSAQFEGATKITYNWGDGRITTVDVTPDSGSNFSARHAYNSPGLYTVTITAENSQGTQTAIVLYDATTGEDTPTTGGDDTAGGDDQKGFIEEHGWLWIVFAALVIVCILGYFVIVPEHPVWIVGALVCIILAALLYVYVDFGGIADKLGELF